MAAKRETPKARRINDKGKTAIKVTAGVLAAGLLIGGLAALTRGFTNWEPSTWLDQWKDEEAPKYDSKKLTLTLERQYADRTLITEARNYYAPGFVGSNAEFSELNDILNLGDPIELGEWIGEDGSLNLSAAEEAGVVADLGDGRIRIDLTDAVGGDYSAYLKENNPLIMMYYAVADTPGDYEVKIKSDGFELSKSKYFEDGTLDAPLEVDTDRLTLTVEAGYRYDYIAQEGGTAEEPAIGYRDTGFEGMPFGILLIDGAVYENPEGYEESMIHYIFMDGEYQQMTLADISDAYPEMCEEIGDQALRIDVTEIIEEETGKSFSELISEKWVVFPIGIAADLNDAPLLTYGDMRIQSYDTDHGDDSSYVSTQFDYLSDGSMVMKMPTTMASESF